ALYDPGMPRVPGTHVDDPRHLGRRLREARERAGLSQRDLAFPGCTNAYISRIESGNRIPSLQVIHEFARRLGVSPQYLATSVEVLARAYALTGALDAAIALLERALLEAEQAEAVVETLRIQILLANALIDSAQVPRAERILADAIRVANLLHDPLATAKVY